MSMPTWEGGPSEPAAGPESSTGAEPDADAESDAGLPAEPAAEAEAEPDTGPPPSADEAWSVVSLIASNGVEPPAGLTDAEAAATWAAVTAPWHPAVLAALATLPTVEGLDDPGTPGPREARVVAGGTAD